MTTSEASATVVLLDGSSTLSKEELGGKAWGINAMRLAGLPVPPAFTLPVNLCRTFLRTATLPETLEEDLRIGLAHLQSETHRQFGGSDRPLLVSVRSGAAQSMPGMMDTVLNLGCTTAVRDVLAKENGNAAWAQDVRSRFVEQYHDVVLQGPGDIPEDPVEQLRQAVRAVFSSWNSPRALAYRAHHGLDDDGGTAVTVQAMVFGNLDARSGTGVLFSRDPLTGSRSPYGEWLPRGQGDDVVSGTCTPLPLAALAENMPDVHERLLSIAEHLEHRARDVQDIEFTVESGRLWILQTRNAKRAPRAAVRTAVEMAGEGLITELEALHRVRPAQIRCLLSAGIDEATRDVALRLASGEPACPGAASGIVVTDPDEAEELADSGKDVVLVRPTTTPQDVAGMFASVAVVTEQGGATSHAALVSREIGVPCVVGTGTGTLAGLAGRTVTVDGETGEVFAGQLLGDAIQEEDDPHLQLLASWADQYLAIKVITDSTELEGHIVPIHDLAALPALSPRSVASLSPSLLEAPGLVEQLLRCRAAHLVARPRLPLMLALLQIVDA